VCLLLVSGLGMNGEMLLNENRCIIHKPEPYTPLSWAAHLLLQKSSPGSPKWATCSSFRCGAAAAAAGAYSILPRTLSQGA
jgi:hypothetical protein